MEEVPIEALSWRLSSAAPGRDIRLDAVRAPGADAVAKRGQQRAYFHDVGFVDCAVYDRYALKPGDSLEGPAVIEERESTCIVGPDATILVDKFLNLIIDMK